ncbi:Transcriptional regulatory protein LnrK [Sporomusa silvacetica DSM 10669]|uniref:Transcriptional regulatory protein LnrK n=1 Tax=Sporomusa silvacetica DSM 10669 TaxID=1123289 RepID=A0ABZ3IU79_9FIRM|nr:response regulator transcription factor [Sporomusa silvacetica]OZC19782.1 transcriptional regulatory protein DegU [Sporomusa silvacetica DSM 10669]
MKVLLVDDNVLFLEGLKDMLVTNDIEVLGTANNGREALRKAEELNPEVVLMDVQMPDGGGIEATRLIKTKLPHVKVVMLTVSQDDDYLFEAIKAGAAGYLLKGLDRERFLELLSGMANGESPLSTGLAAKILAEFARREAEREARENAVAKTTLLTPRNAEILRYVASGLTYKEVGSKLRLSHSAVKYHMGEITARLQLENKSQVIAFAGEMGLILAPEKD